MNGRTIIIKTRHIKPHRIYRGFNLEEMIKVPLITKKGWYDFNNKDKDEWILMTMEFIDWAYDTFNRENPKAFTIFYFISPNKPSNARCWSPQRVKGQDLTTFLQ